ncbi:hypothetical protein ACT17S_11245 [Glutamicibacter mysorens]
MASKQVTLDGQTLHGFDRYGSWRVHTLEGWFDSPAEKSDIISRPNTHGDVPSPVYYNARMVILSGRLSAKSPELAAQARTVLSALVQEEASFWVISSDGVAMSGLARRGKISLGNISGRWLTFQIELKFADPFKYGATESFTVSSGGASYVHHLGTVDAWPVVTVKGSMPDGYTLSYRSQTVSVPMGIPSGVEHRIDFKNRRLYVNGDVFFGAFGSSNFRPVPAGPRTAFGLSCPSGSGTAVVSVTDTYI